jgi:hypothetical protein
MMGSDVWFWFGHELDDRVPYYQGLAHYNTLRAFCGR